MLPVPPKCKGGQLDRGYFVFGPVRVLLLFLAGLAVILVLQVSVGPAIDAPVALVGSLGLIAGLALQLDLPSLGNVDLQLLVEDDALLGKVDAGPELSRGQRIR